MKPSSALSVHLRTISTSVARGVERVVWALLAGLVLIPAVDCLAVGDEPAAKAVRLESLELQVPANWKQQPPNNLRLGQFEIPAAAGDQEPGELTVFNFGGGGVQANVDRWIGQFKAAERKSRVTQGKCPQGEYVFVDVSGTYKKPIGPPIQQRTESAPGYRMLGVILATEKNGYYFLKLTGPEATVAAEAAALRRSIGGTEKDEKPYESKQPE